MKSALTIQLEALLFVAHEPLSAQRLAELTHSEVAAVTAALETLAADPAEHGWQLTQLDGHYQLVTAPAAAEVVRRYLQAESRTELSKAALEALAIIAYRGPLTQTQLNELRGVASDTMLRNLLQRGLIQEQGRASEPGRPVRYGVSQAFLHHFGLSSLAALPPLPEPEQA